MATLAADKRQQDEVLPRPDASGRFGTFGGRYVPETLIPALLELEKEFQAAMNDPEFEASVRATRQNPRACLCLHRQLIISLECWPQDGLGEISGV